MTALSQSWSPLCAAFHGWRSHSSGSASAIFASRRRMKSPWIGSGCSHQSVPSLSKTATRSGTGTGSDPSVPETFATNSTIARFDGPSFHVGSGSLTGHHRGGFALEVNVRFAAHVDGDAIDRAAGERVGRRAGVVVGYRLAAVAPHAQPLAGKGEFARLGFDARLADLLVAVVEREEPGRDARRVLAVLD